MKPTSLKLDGMRWSVDTPAFIKEACENCQGGMYAVCWDILVGLLGQVAHRATELNDPVLLVIMLRLNLVDVDGSDITTNSSSRNQIIEKLLKEIEYETRDNS